MRIPRSWLPRSRSRNVASDSTQPPVPPGNVAATYSPVSSAAAPRPHGFLSRGRSWRMLKAPHTAWTLFSRPSVPERPAERYSGLTRIRRGFCASAPRAGTVLKGTLH
ncbi:hypothetical protein C8Q78DRAFT_709012 [Trametes maxima]|nr:hypothetical protein C8Q78DRAFT_709012 [Trametes maxima]